MTTRVGWMGHSCVALETAGFKVLIDPFLTGNPKAATKAERCPGRFHPGLARPRRPRRRHHRHRQANRGHGHRQLRDQRMAQSQGRRAKSTASSTAAVFSYPLRQGQADAGVSRLRAARRSQRRQPVRVPASPSRTAKGLRRRRHGAVRRHEADRRGRHRPGAAAHRRQLHDGPRRCAAGGQVACSRRRCVPIHYNTFDLIAQDAERLGRAGAQGDAGRAGGAQAGRMGGDLTQRRHHAPADDFGVRWPDTAFLSFFFWTAS